MNTFADVHERLTKKREVKNMCESTVYLIDKNGKESLFFELVDKIVPDKNTIYLEDILGQKKSVNAKIKELALVDHRIVLEEIAE
jgi:predicted RNA-binding protein